MRKFSVKPTLTLKGRSFKGLRGWSGKPTHPPLTDIPVAAYVMAAVLDVVSFVGGTGHEWARTMSRSGTYLFVGGVAMSVLAALTGLSDARSSSEAGTQARRTINTHATVMVAVTVLAIVNLIWRLNKYDTAAATTGGIMVLSIVVAALVAIGATFGGSLVFEYGFNVETAGDHPAWHKSETDVFHGQHDDASS